MIKDNRALEMVEDGSVFNWRLGGDGVAVVEIDVPGEKQNVLNPKFNDDFDNLLVELAEHEGIKALVIISSKPGSFVAGADLKMFEGITDPDEIAALSQRGQNAMKQLASLPYPVVAAIDGACLGGGLELALVCDARVASEGDKTVLGLPEVMLGLLPAAGGTQRLAREIGIASALDLMLTGRQLRPQKARKLGLVDEVVSTEKLLDAARGLALNLASGRKKAGRALGVKDRITNALLEENPLGRALLFNQARKKTLEKTRSNYPAATKIIDVVDLGYRKGLEAGLAAESKALGELALTPQSQGLRSLFHASETLKKENFIGRELDAAPIETVGVLGAGLMGAGIALTSINKAGCKVLLKDKDQQGLDAGTEYLQRFYEPRVERGSMPAETAEEQLGQLETCLTYEGFEQCDLVIEAVFESLALKHQMLEDIESLGNEKLIFATNTSSIPITDIAAAAKRPENVIGLHYFSPVEKMPMLEIITTDKTSPEVIARCVEFGKAQGKTVIVVKDGPGFYTTRILSPYLNEAARLLSEGVPIRAIDEALLDYGFPVGPISLLDEVGIDVGLKVGPILEESFGERMALPDASRKMADNNWLGRKTGRGFYCYEGAKNSKNREVNNALYNALGVTPSNNMSSKEIAERCVFMFANEAAHCLNDGILQQPMHGDIGAVFGLGFVPFSGGPFRFIDAMGVDNFVARLEELRSNFGERFRPAPVLLQMANASRPAKKRFYPAEGS